jgi:nicotinate-nucleotide adenylyltransferase
MSRSGRLGLLGGTFDPFHHGHLAVALAAEAALDLDAVHLVPAHIPPHRPLQPAASAEHRFAMVALGIAETPGLVADDRELHADGASYTSRTLAWFAAEGWTASQMFFITGADAFADIATWHEFPGILDRAHFVVISRPGREATSMREVLPALAARMRLADKASPPSAADTEQPAIWLVNAKTPAVSATAIRHAASEGRSISGLTPPLVEQHIARHGLYGRGTISSSPAAGHLKAASELHAKEHV